MKIPEVSPNGPYYGNDENNGQWQGVVMDSGNMVGSGDAAYHPPPPHFVRPLGPGYVMPGVFYPPQNTYGAMAPPPPQQHPPDDFADYMWMENEEEFEKEVMQQLEEEALMEQCIEAMLEDERERERNNRPVTNGHTNNASTSNGVSSLSLEEQVSKSTLNPLAAEFVPTFAKTFQPTVNKTEDYTEEPTQEKCESEPIKVDEPIKPVPECNTSETPEVSALDSVCSKTERRPKEKDNKKTESKKLTKTEVKPKKTTEPTSKPKTELPKLSRKKSDTAVENKKEETVKKIEEAVLKSEEIVQKCEETVQKNEEIVQKREDIVQKTEDIVQKREEIVAPKEVVVPIIEPVAVTTPLQEEVTIKPINYAAAAKANKNKKPSPPPVQDKPVERPIVKTIDKPKIIESKSVSKSAKSERSGIKKNTAK